MYFTAKPQCEVKLYDALRMQNIPCYLPFVKKTTEYSHRIYTRMVPMFRGYVFASTKPQGFDIEKINSVLGRVYFLNKYESETLLRDLLIVRKYEILAKNHKVSLTDFKVNDALIITRGYFKGERAVIKHFKNHDEVIVQLSSIPIGFTVQLPVDFLSKDL